MLRRLVRSPWEVAEFAVAACVVLVTLVRCTQLCDEASSRSSLVAVSS